MKDQISIYNLLVDALSENEKYVINGKLNIALIADDAFILDDSIVSLLLKNKKLTNFFFKKIKDIHIFDKTLFFQFITNKQLIEDSFTKYKKNIGLTIRQTPVNFNDIILEWPYKDCVLEGGQEEDTENRNEIFWNTLIAKEEINNLFSSKVISSAKLITSSNEQKFKATDKEFFKKSKNYLISGNNLIAAHTLKNKFLKKIKLVYLDPPYNTPGEANTFSYNNRFNHSSWLTFMKNRIEVASKLVSDDGFICFAIDDNEQAYLKVLADEILGRENFIGTVAIQIKKEGRTDNDFFATSHDYAIFYAKNANKAKLNSLPITEEQAKEFKEEDDLGRYKWRDLMRTGGNSTPKERPNQYFEIYCSKKTNKIIGASSININNITEEYDSEFIFEINDKKDCIKTPKAKFLEKNNNIRIFTPIGKTGTKQVWRWSDREKLLRAAEIGEIQVVSSKIKIKDRTRLGSKATTTWYDTEFNATAHGTNLLKKLFNGKKIFSYPKSLHTMMDILRITMNPGDTVLDLFAGSGTTAHAITKLNSFDGGDRSFILVEQMKYIKDTTSQRIKKILDKNTKNFIYFELKKLNYELINKIEKISSKDNLLKITKIISTYEYLSIHKDLNQIISNINNNENFDLKKIKHSLVELIDKSQLYLSYSEIEDKKHNIDKDTLELNSQFYK